MISAAMFRHGSSAPLSFRPPLQPNSHRSILPTSLRPSLLSPQATILHPANLPSHRPATVRPSLSRRHKQWVLPARVPAHQELANSQSCLYRWLLSLRRRWCRQKMNANGNLTSLSHSKNTNNGDGCCTVCRDGSAVLFPDNALRAEGLPAA